MKKILIITFISLSLNSIAQSDKINLFAKVSEPGTVELKWISAELYGQREYFVERQVGRDRERLNNQPLKLAHVPKPSEQNLRMMADYSETASFKELDGMIGLAMMLQAAESEILANYFGIYFKDENAPKQSLTYRIIDGDGNELASINVDASKNAKTQGPLKPSLLAGDSEAHIDITLEAKRFYAYNLLRSENASGPFEKLNQMPLLAQTYDEGEHFYTDLNLTNGVTYYYQIEGMDFFGDASEPSATVEVTPIDLTPPVPVDNLTAQGNESAITLEWQPSESADLAGYRIYRSSGNEENYSELTEDLLPKLSLSYTDRPQLSGVYYYRVIPVDRAGNEGNSRDVFAEIKDLTPPATPQNLRIESREGEITLAWDANSESDLFGYWIYRSSAKSEQRFSLLNGLPIKETNFTESLPKQAKNGFRYYVVAVDTNMNKSEPTKVIVGKLPDVTPPHAPFIKSLEANDAEVRIEWNPTSATDVEKFDVLRRAVAQNTWDTITTLNDRNAQSYTDLPTAGNWEYSLVATDSTGNRSETAEPRQIELLALAEAPIVSAITVSLGTDEESPTIRIGWEVESTEGLRGYIVYRKQNNESFKPISGLISENTFSDGQVKPGIEYTYQVRSLSISGKIAASEESKFMVNE